MAENTPSTNSQLGKLCPTCRNMFDTWDEIVEELEFYFQFGRPGQGCYGLPFHKDAISWRTEVENGCVFCMRLFDSLKEDANLKVIRSRRKGEVRVYLKITSIGFVQRKDRWKRDYSLWVSVGWVGEDTPWLQLDGGVELLPRPIETVLELELASSTSSDQSLAFVKNWIKSCRNDHPQCRTNADFNLPTRLIELHEEGIRLWTPGDTTEKHDYATLSHCWGALETLKLMKSNVEALSSKILLASLCKTFQDAVLVTHSLGYRFLWVDSLCIVQDDEDDWHRESALMSEVYGNAGVNLAATDAEDGSGGLFRQRVVTRIARQYVQTKSLQTYELPDERLYFRCLDRSLLSRRAWVFQERYLARRTIHFSAEQIFCECRCQIACEGYPNGAPVRPSDPDDIPFPRERKTGDPEKWRDIIQLYTRAQLTYPEDKLVALSGVARQFQSLNGDQYVAGMWRTGLELYLCWRVERSSESRHSAPELGTSLYRAPSWSWASTDQPISWILYMTPLKNTFGNTNLRCLIDILDVDLVHAGPDPFGQLQNASLDIQCGPLIRGSLIVSLLNDFERPFDNSYKIHLDDGKTFLLRGEGQIHTDLESKYQSEAENLYFLPILIDTNTECMHYRTGVTMYGLVVTRANSDRPGLFTRFGVWEIIFNVGSYPELMKPFLTQPDTLMDESLYGNFLQDEEDGSHSYSITLV